MHVTQENIFKKSKITITQKVKRVLAVQTEAGKWKILAQSSRGRKDEKKEHFHSKENLSSKERRLKNEIQGAEKENGKHRFSHFPPNRKIYIKGGVSGTEK